MILEYQSGNFKLKLEAVGYKEAEKQKIQEAARLMVYAMGHSSFKDFCLNYKYKVKKCYWKGIFRKCYWKEYKNFYKSGGRTNYQVYKHLMSGQESLPGLTDIDHEADVFLKIDRRYKKGVVGWTSSKTKWQYIYQWVFREKDAIYIAGNLAHEWTHKLGYSHSKNNNSHRKHTVSYATGNFVRSFLKEQKGMT